MGKKATLSLLMKVSAVALFVSLLVSSSGHVFWIVVDESLAGMLVFSYFLIAVVPVSAVIVMLWIKAPKCESPADVIDGAYLVRAGCLLFGIYFLASGVESIAFGFSEKLIEPSLARVAYADLEASLSLILGLLKVALGLLFLVFRNKVQNIILGEEPRHP